MADEKKYGEPVKVQREDAGERVTAVQVRTTEHITDPDHELAVQIPEGVGASGVEDAPVGSVYDDGDAEAQFREGRQQAVITGEQPEPRRVSDDEDKDKSSGRKSRK